jgi:hypothetical protein
MDESTIQRARETSERIRMREDVPCLSLDSAAVPALLRPLVPHAEILGVGDDPVRGEIVEELEPEYLRGVGRLVGSCSPDFDEWMEAQRTPYAPEYIAFSCMMRALEAFYARPRR